MSAPINWSCVLNYKHAPSLTYTLFTYSRKAKELGYPYFCWNDRVYDTETGEDTGYYFDRSGNFSSWTTFPQSTTK